VTERNGGNPSELDRLLDSVTSGDAPAPAGGEPVDPLKAFAELGRLRLDEGDLRHVLTRIAELAKATIPGAAEVSVTLVSGDGAGTPAFTGELALALDETQYDSGYGPCLEAAMSNRIFSAPDLATETRWPAFAAAATQAGVRSSLSVGVPVTQQMTGAINIYALQTNAFDEEAVELATTFANYAAVAMANAHLYDTTAALATQMAQAMESRSVIEQAKGILMAQRGESADEAFAIMVRASQVSNRKVRDIAQALVDSSHNKPHQQ
jgi:GAF domain-containing protein